MSLIGRSIGNYRVIAKIGEGGMGSVYLGEHPLIGKRVAIKVLHPELATRDEIVSRFFQEAKAVNAIGHTNIVDVIDFGRTVEPGEGDVVYFVMELLDGEGLSVRLKREGVSLNEAVAIAAQCASALAASHAKSIVHRDLKPENIYLVQRGDERNYVKLLDFGIAKLTGGDAQVPAHKTRTGLVIGTPTYMSPEQCDGKGLIDHRADIYALGIVLYEMLTGTVPFPGEGFGEVLVAHLTRPAAPPSTLRHDLPRALDAIVMRAIEKDRTRRFQSMTELRAALLDPDAYLASPAGPRSLTEAATLMLDGVAPGGPSPALPTPLARPAPASGAATLLFDAQGPRAHAPDSPRSTTLTGASGEVSVTDLRPPSRASRAPLWAAIGLLTAGAGVGSYYVVARHRAAPSPTASASPATPRPVAASPTSDDMVLVTIDSRPSGATLYRSGHDAPIGKTPYELRVKRADGELDVLLRLAGYRDAVKTVNTSHDHEMLVALAPGDGEPAPPPVADAPSPARAAAKSQATASASSGAPASARPTTRRRPPRPARPAAPVDRDAPLPLGF